MNASTLDALEDIRAEHDAGRITRAAAIGEIRFIADLTVSDATDLLDGGPVRSRYVIASSGAR